jgi:hypothetical protein
MFAVVLKQKGRLGIVVNGLPLQGSSIGIDAAGITISAFGEDSAHDTFLAARAVAAKLEESGILPGYAFDIVAVSSDTECLAAKLDAVTARLDTLTSIIADLITRDPLPQPPQEEMKAVTPVEPVQEALPLPSTPPYSTAAHRVVVNPGLDIKPFLHQVCAAAHRLATGPGAETKPGRGKKRSNKKHGFHVKRLHDVCLSLGILSGRDLCAASPVELQAAAAGLGVASPLGWDSIYIWEQALLDVGLGLAPNAKPTRFRKAANVGDWSLAKLRDRATERGYDAKTTKAKRRAYAALISAGLTLPELLTYTRPKLLDVRGISFVALPLIEEDLAELGLTLRVTA